MQLKADNYIEQIKSVARKSFVYVAIFSCVFNVLMLVPPIYMLQIYDRVLTSQSTETLVFLTIIAIFALAILALCDHVRLRLLSVIAGWFDAKVSVEALKRCPDSLLSGEPYGAQSIQDILQIRHFLAGQALLMLFDSPWVLIFLGLLFLMHPVLGGISLVFAAALFAIAYLNERQTRLDTQYANRAQAKNQQHLSATLSRADTIQGMGMLSAIIERWQSQHEDVAVHQNAANLKASLFVPTSKFIRLTAQVFILGVGAYLVILQQITPGMMIAASIIMGRALAPIEQAIGTWRSVINARQAYGRLQLYFNQDEKRQQNISLPEPKGLLQLEELTYQPPGASAPTIYQISFAVKPGDILGIIGPSGSGKSTLARLIVGAYCPTHGHVRLDSADVYHWNREDFGQFVGFLPQEIELFQGSVAQNIARMREVDEEAVVKAAQITGAHEMILHMPQGYNTPVETIMHNLSGGQRQRIALARAFYNEPKLLVLDEPDANLDTSGEQALQQAMRYAKEKQMTTLVVSHRQSMLDHVDKLLMLNEGKLQLFGPKEKVLAYLRGEHVEQGGHG